MRKTSVKGLARQAVRDDNKARLAQAKNIHQGSALVGVTHDTFVNFAQKMGVGADNPLTTASYSFNPTTRNRQSLEWMYRGSWIAGMACDVIADDMTRAGVDFVTEMEPEDQLQIEELATQLGVWDRFGDGIRFGRLYGGALVVALIDGQDFQTPLREETVMEDQFKGLLVLDRWMVEPDLSDLVTEFGPDLGLPKYYRVMDNAPALRGAKIHHTRVMLREIGIQLPYQQALTENLWGESVLERIYDRMVAYDSASTGAAQLVYKSHLRTLKVEDLRSIVAAGGDALKGLLMYMENLRRFQGNEGISLIDSKDEMEAQVHGAFSGLSDAILQFAQQLAGALGIPLVRMLGQSPAGLNSTGESDLRTYYDGINQQQNKRMHRGITLTYRLMARSQGIEPPDDFAVNFSSLWQLQPKEKAEIAKGIGEAVGAAYEGGLIGLQTALRELRQASKDTGVFTNITDAAIEAADDEVLPPLAETEMGLEHEKELADADRQHQATEADKARKAGAQEAEKGRKHALQLAKEKAKEPGGRKRTPLK